MKSWIKIFLVLLTLQGVAQAAPRDDFFTSLNSDTAYSRSVDDFTYKTQALRLLGIISSSSAAVLTPTIDQGLSQHRLISAATTNATVVKASQGNIYNIQAFNNGVAAAYLKFYNIATSPTVGTTTTVKVLMLPPGGGLTVDSSAGIQFATGISYSIVTNLVDTDATAIAINQVAVNIDFR